MEDSETLGKFLAEELKKEQGTTLSVLDMLRRTRKSRGGVGAPLEIPSSLKGASEGQGIIITDADLKLGLTKAGE